MTFTVRGLQFHSGQLAPGAVGSLVHADGKAAMVAISTAPQASSPPTLLLAGFDPTTQMFTISTYNGEPVLSLGDELTFEPDLSVPSEYEAPGVSSKSECYYDGGGPYVRLYVPAAPEQCPLLDLAAGHISTQPAQKMHVFKRWRLGVREGDRVTWVFAVGAKLDNWACDVR